MYRFVFFSLVAITAAATLFHTGKSKENEGTYRKNTAKEAWITKAKARAVEARSFVKTKDYNNNIVFLLDMNIPSGSERFFVYHLKKDSIIHAGLVTHGSCNESFLSGRKYSNVVGSGCTSLGKYKIGKSYYGQFGLAWKLYGLDAGNSNAYKRFVVLHSHDCVPDAEVNEELCQSLGCPTVSPNFLKTIKPMLDHSDKPVLLWVYDSSKP